MNIGTKRNIIIVVDDYLSNKWINPIFHIIISIQFKWVDVLKTSIKSYMCILAFKWRMNIQRLYDDSEKGTLFLRKDILIFETHPNNVF